MITQSVPGEPEGMPPAIELSREKMLEELLSWCKSFQQRSAEWRRSSYETQWARWQRNSDSIFDPEIAQKKESWQNKVFIPMTPSHRENALAKLFKNEVGPRPPLEMKARPNVPHDLDQSANIRDMILREREKSRYETERNKVLDDKTTYGSGFARMRFEDRKEDRVMTVPVMESVSVFDPTSIMRAMRGQQRIIGYEKKVMPQTIYRGVRFEHISIWDIFPDPKALEIRGNAIAYRYDTTYGEIVKGASEGYYLPEAAEKLKNLPSAEISPEDKKVVEADRAIADSAVHRTEYGSKLQCFELYARLPKKWVLIDGQDIDDPEALIPAKIQFHNMTVISVEVNDSYDGEPPIYKDDYFPVAGQFYARGIPEMLKDLQLVMNEEVCQRLDFKALGLNQMFAVLEKAVVDPRDLVSKAGGIIRLNDKAFGGQPFRIQDVLQRLDFGTLDRATFIETQDLERFAQERTSITRQTLGTAGQVKDANQTLGGMELVKADSGDKLAYLGMLSEFGFQYEVNRAFWRLIYSNYQPEDVIAALGPERAATFIPQSPEEVENAYQYIPMGVFTMENKAMRQARLGSIRQQFAGAPWVNDLAFFDAELMSADEDPSRFKVPEAEAVQIMFKAEQMAVGMAQQLAAQNQPKSGKEASGGPPRASQAPAGNA